MTGADKVVCQAATLLVLFALTSAPAKAQFAGFGGGGGGDMMTQMAPMLEMMKAKMGKRRFAMMMQTMGPMMGQISVQPSCPRCPSNCGCLSAIIGA